MVGSDVTAVGGESPGSFSGDFPGKWVDCTGNRLAAPADLPGNGLDGWLERVACLRAAESVLRELFLAGGFREVTLPVVERVGAERGKEAGPHVAGMGGYRFLDGEGRVWALRSDVTPGLARLVWEGDPGGTRPRRLFYFAEVYRRVPGEPAPTGYLQVGVEVIGGQGAREDAGVLRLAEAVLRSLGVPEFRLTVGHVGILREMLGRAGLAGDRTEAVLGALQSRDYVAVREVVRSVLAPTEAERLLELLTWREGSVCLPGRDVPPGKDGSLPGAVPPAREDLGDRWGELRALFDGGPSPERVVLDPGLVRDREYYTGMVFEISLPGVSQPVGGGGRYDGTLSPEPAVGFAFDLEAVLAAVAKGLAAGRGRARVSPASLDGRLQVAAIH
ncbi:MAG: ATP phosphoribosyltransferase regulatory subunit [Firmicutes bacterium]|nr:ATP phosphoribosyltransferase regulatory subunit [Bacillota bacterium]